MKLSIVTISFNQAAFLERAIRSVIDQDHKDLEYIVVDAGSTDGSRDIIGRYRDRFAKIIFEPDDGPADGLNRGFACATGDICGYLNSDDALLPGAISRVCEAFTAHPDADIVHGHGYFVDTNDNILRRFRSDRYNVRRHVFGGVVLMQQATFFRRTAFLGVGGFNAGNRTCWDGELWVDLALSGKNFQRVDEYWAIFRIHDQSITGSGRLNEIYERDQMRIFEKVMKRPKRSLDKILHARARLEKWAGDPANLAIRLADDLLPKPRLSGR